MIDYKGDQHGELEVKITFKVFDNTISEDAWLKLRMNDGVLSGDVDAEFQPHGITFSKPAVFNIEAKYVDLTGVNPSTVALYYVNDNGEWEKMKTEEISVKIDDGIIKIMDAEIPHFSRYAVAWSN